MQVARTTATTFELRLLLRKQSHFGRACDAASIAQLSRRRLFVFARSLAGMQPAGCSPAPQRNDDRVQCLRPDIIV